MCSVQFNSDVPLIFKVLAKVTKDRLYIGSLDEIKASTDTCLVGKKSSNKKTRTPTTR